MGGGVIMLEYSKEYIDSTNTDTLGNRIKFGRNRINELCAKIRDKRLMKIQYRGLYLED